MVVSSFVRQLSICFALLLATCYSEVSISQNFPQIKTYGFDYVRFADKNVGYGELNWLARHHDWIVGPKAVWPNQGVDYVDSETYQIIKSSNPETKIMKYIAYHSIAPTSQEWMESWCKKNGYNPEDLYYHYYRDTSVRLTNKKYLVVPGFGAGNARSLKESRLRVRWNGGWVGINPSSKVFRKAFQALALHVVTVEGMKNTYADGLFLDTFEGIIDNRHWTSHLENTIEMKDLGSTMRIYERATQDLVQSKVELEKFLVEHTGNPKFRLHINAADVDYIYNQYQSLYGKYRSSLMDVSIEFLISTTSGMERIKRLQEVFDDMENGRQFFIRSQTNFSPPKPIRFGYQQFVLATHYLINHPNANFFYHYGNAGNYGGAPYGKLKSTHWNMNMEVDIGKPTLNDSRDYWGATGTNRFYIVSQEGDSEVLARKYTKGLVVAKFPKRGGFSGIGKDASDYPLGGKYRRLREDNTLGEVIESIRLGNSEGAILLKVDAN